MIGVTRLVLPLLFALFSWTCWPAQAFAHSVQTDYRMVAESLEIQSTFSTGEAMEGAMVEVYAPNDPTHPWLQGTTDQDGKFLFLPDRTIAGEWSIKIGANDHGDELAVPVNEQGVEIDEISARPYEAPHPVANQFAKQMVVAGILLGGSLGTTGLLQRRRRR